MSVWHGVFRFFSLSLAKKENSFTVNFLSGTMKMLPGLFRCCEHTQVNDLLSKQTIIKSHHYEFVDGEGRQVSFNIRPNNNRGQNATPNRVKELVPARCCAKKNRREREGSQLAHQAHENGIDGTNNSKERLVGEREKRNIS